MNHLEPEVQTVIRTFSIPNRIEHAQKDNWIPYPKAEEALAKLQELLSYPRTLRMPNLLLVGTSGNGKSTITDHFRSLHERRILEDGTPSIPVLSMQMPSEPKEARFWSEMLRALHVPFRELDSVQRKKAQAQAVLTLTGCRMLILDEIHNVLYGHLHQQRHFLGVLKNLSNELKLPIVAVGIPDSIRTLHTDTQLTSRFEVFSLPDWKLDRTFGLLLTSFEYILPLARPSNLTSREIAIKIQQMCGGTIGGVSRILRSAAVLAIKDGSEAITISTLDKINWTRLQDYGKQAASV